MLCYAKSLKLCPTLWDPMDVGCQVPLSKGFSRQEYWNWVLISFLQWIFPTQGLNPRLLHCKQILLPLSHWGSPQGTETEVQSPSQLLAQP